MQDATGLLLSAGIDLQALEPGERLQRSEGEVGIDEHRHPRRDQRIAAEQRHEPRRARGHDGAVGEFGIEDAQAGQVLGRTVEQRPELVVVARDGGHTCTPFLQPSDGSRAFHRLTALVPRRDLELAYHRCHLDARRPAAAGRHNRLVHDVVAVDAGGSAEVDERCPLERVPLVAEAQPGADGGDLELTLFVDAPLFDLEEIGEVGVDEQLDRAEGGFLAVVLDLEVFAHASPDVAAPEQQEVRVGEPLRRVPAQHEHTAEGIGCGRGERLGRQSVERAAELGDEARVAKEEPLRTSRVDLAGAVRDTKCRALDERHDAFGADARAGAGRPGLRHRRKLLPEQPLPNRPWRRPRIRRHGSRLRPR